MARHNAKILASIWSDPDFVACTAGAQRMFFLVLSQTKLTLVGGLDYRPAKWSQLASDTTREDVDKAVDELHAARFLVVDRDTEEVLVRTFTRHDIPAGRMNINLLKGIWSAWQGLQSTNLRFAAVDNMPEHLWTDARLIPPPEAVRLRRSRPLEPTVETYGSNLGCDRRTEPPLTSHLSPSTHSSSSTVSRTGTPPEPDEEPIDPRLTPAARILGRADHERAVADGTTIGDHAAYRTTCITNRADSETLADALAENPDLDAHAIADLVLGRETPTTTPGPTDATVAAQRALAERNARRAAGTACPTCDDHGHILDQHDLAVPCPECSPCIQPTDEDPMDRDRREDRP